MKLSITNPGATVASILKNSGWLFFDKFARLVLGVTVGAWVARYLGPAQFGELAYAISFIAMFQYIANLGLDGVVVRLLATSTAEAPIILGTVFRLRMLAGVLGWGTALLAVATLGLGDSGTLSLVAIIGAMLVFQAGDTVDLWFISREQNQRSVKAKLWAYSVSAAVKVSLVLASAPLTAFAWAVALDFLAVAIAMFFAYKKYTTASRWRWDTQIGAELLKAGFPFMVAGISIMIYSRIDQLFIGELLGDAQLGTYAAMLPISQLWHVVPMTLLSTVAPYLARLRENDLAEYDAAMVTLCRLLLFSAIFLSMATALISRPLIEFLYGTHYSAAASVLQTHVFSNVPVFLGIAQKLWFINENRGNLAIFVTLLGAIASVSLNQLLIPEYGLHGAAYACVLSFSISAVFGNLICAPKLFLMQIGFKVSSK